ncbi:MAG: SDR family NAD(P)-dependent oxidoreductase [Dehalococcoidia bacterium]
MLLQGKVAVITGSAVGIGRGIAIAAAEEGADVACLDYDPSNNAKTAAMVRALGRTALAIDCDVADKLHVRRAFAEVIDRFGRIDLLVNNAAIWVNTALTQGSFESQAANYEASINGCALGSFYCALAAAPVMPAGSNIVNIITEHIKEGHYIHQMAAATGYDGAKFVQWRQTEAWALELKPRGIRVNAICPGATDTPMLRGVSVAAAENGMKPADVGLAVMNIVRQGADGPIGQSWLVGPSGSKTGRADAEALANLA